MILFCDILVVLECLGAHVDFVDGVGPVVSGLSATEFVNRRLAPPVERFLTPFLEGVAGTLGYAGEAIRILRPELDRLQTPLIGFCGGAFTVASYWVEGGSSKQLKKTRQLMLREPEAFRTIMTAIEAVTIAYLQLQIDAGVDALQIFDTWAGVLPYPEFQPVIVESTRRVVAGLKRPERLPVTVFMKGGPQYVAALADTGATVLSVDCECSIPELRRVLPAAVALQGNIDPYWLYAPPERLVADVKLFLDSIRGLPGVIVNLGHGVFPDIDPSQVQRLVDTVKEF